jgi:protein-disulfide isomerase-like protein with CxxC motif
VQDGGDASVASAWAKQAHSLGLPADKAQALYDAHAKTLSQREQEARAGWLQQAQNDPEIGGTKLQESVAVAQKAMQRFASPGFVQFLQQTGLDSHPEMVRVFRAVGLAISPDAKLVGGAPVGRNEQAALQRMYPNSQKG